MLRLMAKLFWLSTKNDQRTWDSTKKITTGQGTHYTTGFVLNYISAIIIRW